MNYEEIRYVVEAVKPKVLLIPVHTQHPKVFRPR